MDCTRFRKQQYSVSNHFFTGLVLLPISSRSPHIWWGQPPGIIIIIHLCYVKMMTCSIINRICSFAQRNGNHCLYRHDNKDIKDSVGNRCGRYRLNHYNSQLSFGTTRWSPNPGLPWRSSAVLFIVGKRRGEGNGQGPFHDNPWIIEHVLFLKGGRTEKEAVESLSIIDLKGWISIEKIWMHSLALIIVPQARNGGRIRGCELLQNQLNQIMSFNNMSSPTRLTYPSY